ncbi:MAG: hypothetical protein GOVbin2604_4 [Gammaproteobacteria virus GOV_bin_2604]|nr:MAG: hypothetical protein GOVbin2604_4 [Gammaproteobacteria virus GOV_bin_2604]|tara:strand:- start:359 stop:514 length:156 start_codon:yes stop_codon:yes gene_type:complete
MVKKSTNVKVKSANTKKKTVKKEENSVINSQSGMYLGVALITLLLISLLIS